MDGRQKAGVLTAGPDDSWAVVGLLARLANRFVALVFAALLLLLVLAVLAIALEEMGIVITGVLVVACIFGVAFARLLSRTNTQDLPAREVGTAVLLPVALALAVWVATAGTVLSGQVCRDPDWGGCDDNPGYSEVAHDADWYGWPILWKTDMSPERYRELEAGLLLIDRDGISFSALLASLSVWFAMAMAAQAPLLGGWLLWSRSRRRRSQTRLGSAGSA
jgi:hypothetical protein